MPKPNSSDEVLYQIQLIQVKINCLFLVSVIMVYFVATVDDQKPNLKYQINVQCPSFGPVERRGISLPSKKVNKQFGFWSPSDVTKLTLWLYSDQIWVSMALLKIST